MTSREIRKVIDSAVNLKVLKIYECTEIIVPFYEFFTSLGLVLQIQYENKILVH